MADLLTIRVKSLKDLLSLFDPDDALEILSLGDTWHPSSGFVDEEILEGRKQVGELLKFNYDFSGLVEFQAILGNVKLSLTQPYEYLETYEVSGPQKELRILSNKIIELNILEENRFQYYFGKK